jgi:dihydrolipoamide dehydrogenase
MDYNVVVIGAGSGGLVSAYICAAVKAKVALIEKHRMGGDCLNTGCVPSKALIRSASVVSQIRRHKEFGLEAADVKIDFAQVMERVQRVISKVAPHDSITRYTSLGVDCYHGAAKILSPNAVEVDGKKLTTKNIIVATGGGPAVPDIKGIQEAGYLHTENIWDIRVQPKRLVVVGGGPIGCELGQAFARLGCKVTLIQRGAQLLHREDDEVVDIMQKRFEEEGIDVCLNAKPVEVVKKGNEKIVRLAFKDGTKKEVACDQILVAVGRKANATGFGLEALGVKLAKRGTIEIDEYCRTNVKNIFACGDVAGPYQFTHFAAHQAWYCAVNALFRPLKKFKADYSIIPWITYTDPEIARVGLNEKEAKEQNIPFEVSTYGLDDLDRAIADEEDYGLVKVLTVPKKDKILGATICGHHAGNLLPGFIYAMKYGLGMSQILGSIHPYPSMGEANKYVAGVWKKAHAPEGLLNWVQKFHTLRRR